jgi:hypothetical protein
MAKKRSKPARKPESKPGKSPAERSELSPEVQEELSIGREFMAQYDKTFKAWPRAEFLILRELSRR